MNRNTPSHFGLAPQVEVNRSSWSRPSGLKTSFNVGDLVPIYCDEVLPGDTFKIKTSKVLRLQTLLDPVMDNLFVDVYYFFVPNRLVWTHWVNLMGENSDSAWIPQVEYSVPQLEAPSGGWNVGTIADYFGIPTGVGGISVNALPFRAYALICDQWFRDQNNSQPLNIPVTDSNVTGVNTGNYVTDTAKGGKPFVACKLPDYMTACLPSPQRGPDVPLPLGDIAPVFAGAEINTGFDFPKKLDNTYYPVRMQGNTKDPGAVLASDTYAELHAYGNNIDSPYQIKVGPNDGTYPGSQDALYPVNLYADMAQATATSINQLRNAFQIQRMLEKDARGGTRMTELLRSHFGVISPDARLQRAEYLGGNRCPLNVQQVAQTSSTDQTTPQAHIAAFSQTADVNYDFAKSFTEHGFIIGLAVARYEHSYQQGIERMWSRTGRYDYYWPSLAHLGEQAVLNKEIFATGTSIDNEVFGYQEAFADYRYKPNRITGEMRTAANGALDKWHFADNYTSLPYLSDSWIREDKTNIDRALAVTSSTANQVFGDFYFDCKVTRCMPLYSIPGLIDHF